MLVVTGSIGGLLLALLLGGWGGGRGSIGGGGGLPAAAQVGTVDSPDTALAGPCVAVSEGGLV